MTPSALMAYRDSLSGAAPALARIHAEPGADARRGLQSSDAEQQGAQAKTKSAQPFPTFVGWGGLAAGLLRLRVKIFRREIQTSQPTVCPCFRKEVRLASQLIGDQSLREVIEIGYCALRCCLEQQIRLRSPR